MMKVSFEQSRVAYWLDFALQGAAAAAMVAFALLTGPQDFDRAFFALLGLGLALWTAIEYAMHRFLFHGVQPFRRWHGAHHRFPLALIGTPSIASAIAIAGLVFLPVMYVSTSWAACSLTSGVVIGYFIYGLTHHAIHHWPCRNAWLHRRRRLHALHHQRARAGNFGVTSAFWDYVFGTRQPVLDQPKVVVISSANQH